MSKPLRFAVNRICASTMPFDAFAAMVQRLGVSAVELRNDLPDVELAAGTAPERIAAVARENGLTVRSINALQRFEQYDNTRDAQARELVRCALATGAEAIVLCPTNSRSDSRSAEQRHADLVQALRRLQPLLADNGLTGLVESLGFAECAVRRKSQAVRAIREVGDKAGVFALVHDTFHHHLAGEEVFFPELTGLVHISGVEEQSLPVADMRDGHRVLVGAGDRLGNVAQLQKLLASGYAGYLSFEPFAAHITAAADIEQRLSASMAYLSTAVAASAGA